MPKRLIIDLRRSLRDFEHSLSSKIARLPEYVIEEIVMFVFDVFVYELEDHHEEPDLTRLGNFYRDYLEPDPRFQQMFLESFFDLLKAIADELRAHNLYTGDGFMYYPERNNHKNRSIVVKKFD